jgi:uncharacterized cupredoxin-like copper-binding protein
MPAATRETTLRGAKDLERRRGYVNLHTRILSVAAASAALTAAACGGGSSAPSSSAASSGSGSSTSGSTKVAVAAGEFYFHVDRTSVPAGKVAFVVNNEGNVGHEMVIVKTETRAGELPYEKGEASEQGAVGEVGEDDLEVGMTSTLTLDLKPGHYALICNLPGHYKGGMYADFTVT